MSARKGSKKASPRSPRSPKELREEAKEILRELEKEQKKSPKKEAPECPICKSRKNWLEHVSWSREVGILILLKVPKEVVNASIARVLQNQKDLGKWFADNLKNPSVGKEVTRLLTIHAKEEVKIVTGLRESDPKLKKLQEDWNKNAVEIADTISQAGQEHGFNWPDEELRDMMLMHLQLKTEQATKFYEGDYAGAVEAGDKVETEIIKLSDLLAKALEKECGCS